MNEREIFSAALDIDDPARRAAYLDEACASDPALRQRVEALIDAHKPADSFLERPAGGLVATIDEPPLAERPGSIIGPYKLLQQIGEGGMGVVYMAEQTEPVRRRVALKIIKPGMDSRQVIVRFEAERQALAMMDHQNIARVLDAGTTASGRPYFVMELVHGVPITRYCDENKLTPRERLELFVPVCQAVQHAHQKGVIHRDLKPSNIMVTLYDGKPAPKVIDFGVAKATEQRLTERTLFTQYGTIVGTMEYMAPEQAEMSALGVDTRSDVYSLGVLLYELLTGTTPLERGRLRGAALDEMMRLIREEEPPRPSARISTSGKALAAISQQRGTEAAKLAQMMRGELDWIVMKALEKDRTRRYDSASGFARDVQHYLADEAVEACPPTLGYRVRKFARKNKKALTAAAAFAALLLTGIAVSSWQAILATRAEEHAIAERDETEKAREAEAVQRAIAVVERNTAQQERDDARTARAELRRTHYAVSMNLIQTAWEADNLSRVLELLDATRPGPNEEDLRGFEWHYWDRLCHAERRSLTLAGPGHIHQLTLSGDGSRIAGEVSVDDGDEKSARFVKVWDTASGRELRSWPRESTARVLTLLAFDRGGSRLAGSFGRATPVAGDAKENRLDVWEVATGKVLLTRTGLAAVRLAFSPDGKRLTVVEGEDSVAAVQRNPRVMKVCDLGDPGREPMVMEGLNVQNPQDVQFSPDGTRLAAIYMSDNRSYSRIQLWDTATGKVRAKIDGEPLSANFTGLAFSPDGAQLAAATQRRFGSAPADARTFLWDGAAGDEFKLLRSTPMAASGSVKLAFSPDGRTLVVWARMVGSPLVRLVDADSGVVRQVLKGHVRIVESVAFSPDGTRLITAGDTIAPESVGPVQGSRGPSVKEWDVTPTADPRPPDLVTIQSRAGDRMAVYQGLLSKKEGGSEVSIRDRAGKEIFVFREHTQRVIGVTFSPDGRLVVSRGLNGEVKIWEPDTGKVRWASDRVPAGQGPLAAPRPQFSPNGRLVALHEADGVKVVSADDFRELFTVGNATELSFSPDGRRLIAVHLNPFNRDQPRPREGVMKLWDVDAGREIMSVHAFGSGIVVSPDVRCFSPDSRLFAIAGNPQMDLTVWDAITGEQRITLKGSSAQQLAFNPDRTRLVTSTNVARGISGVTVWDLGTGQVLHRLQGHSGTVENVGFSPDGKRIVSSASGIGGQPSEVKLWDAVTGRELLSLVTNVRATFRIFGVSFSPDGHRLLLQGGMTGSPAAFRSQEQVWDATPRAEK